MNMKNLANWLLMLAILAFTACQSDPGTASGAEAETTGKPLNIGDKASDFELKDFEGRSFKLSDLKRPDGKVPRGYVVLFSNLNCPYAKAYETRSIELANTIKADGYILVVINTPYKDMGTYITAEMMREEAVRMAYPFFFLNDTDGSVAAKFGATALPEAFVFDADRKLLYTGRFDDNFENPNEVKLPYVERAIQLIESGQKPQPEKTKAIGCNI